MSDQDPTPTPSTDPTPTPSDKGGADHEAEAAKWKELARKHETRAKENAEKAKKFDDLEESSKSELQKATERAAEAERRAAAAEAASLRASVAQSKGVPADMISGSSKEELEASADALLKWKGDKPSTTSAGAVGRTGEPVGGSDKPTLNDAFRALRNPTTT